MKRPWLFHISTCMLTAVFCVVGIIIGIVGGQGAGGWSFLMAIILMPVLFALLLADFLIKALTKGNVLYIWIIEAVVVAIFIIWTNNHYF